jgi:hypothetical protein
MDTNKNNRYYCDICDYKCNYKSDFIRHQNTKKHRTKLNIMFKCDCNKIYNTKSSLNRHKRICLNNENEDENENKIVNYLTNELKNKENMIIQILSQNQDMMKTLMENKYNNQIFTNSDYNNINSNNKTFNIQFFLNETCKNALNLSEFMEFIELNVEDLCESNIGYVKNIYTQFSKFYNKLPIEKRPFHCTDVKRKVIYIKENNKWTCLNIREQLTKLAGCIEKKNSEQLKLWQQNHPHIHDGDHKQSDYFMNIVYNSLRGGDEEERQNNITKLIDYFAKESVIKKENYLR